MRSEFPTGPVTFLLPDLEGSRNSRTSSALTQVPVRRRHGRARPEPTAQSS